MMTCDERWALAGSIQLTPAADTFDDDLHGLISARPHPTGWFISARYHPELSAAELEDFSEFVRVRTYLLLTNGPQESTWEPGGDGSFRALCEPSDPMQQEWIAA